MLFANPVSLARLSQPPHDSLAMPSMDLSTCSTRIGRGGRLILSRCQPFTLEPLETDEQQQPTEEATLRPAFDLTAPYAAAQAQYQQEQQLLPRQQSQGQMRQPSPGGQAAKAPQQQQGPARTQSGGHGQSQAVPTQTPQPSASQPAGQQTRQQQQQQQQHPQLIEMPSQPGANLNDPSPPKSKVLLLMFRGCKSC